MMSYVLLKVRGSRLGLDKNSCVFGGKKESGGRTVGSATCYRTGG